MTDGQDHINIYSKGETALGRALSNFSGHPVETTDGRFASIEGYWYWLNASAAHPRRDELRNLTGWKAKAVGRELRAADWNDDPLFRFKIINAMITKLILHPAIYAQFKASTLPFRHYYVYNEKPVEPKEGRWIIQTWEFLRKLARADES